MRSTYYPGVCTEPGTYYQGWFMYMRYTQGQNEEYLLSRSVHRTRYLLSTDHWTPMVESARAAVHEGRSIPSGL